ncbi:MAG: hypothetical protein JRI55_38595, partial [Deltaproteobacteria bacterium]|nr:hypothetical protein [Deltaproteobacteria bacterium]
MLNRQWMGVALVLALVACKEMDRGTDGIRSDEIRPEEIRSSTFALTGNTTLLPIPITGDDEKIGWSQDLHGDTAVVGAWAHDAFAGAVHIFTRTGKLWALQQTFKPITTGRVWFGRSVAIEGDLLAVGVPRLYVNAAQPGGVYIYERTGTTWAHAQTITTADPGVEGFGTSLALDGDTLLIGAPLSEDQPAAPDGLAYVYVRDPATKKFFYQATLTPQRPQEALGLGGVSVSGDFAVVGDNGGQTELYQRIG